MVFADEYVLRGATREDIPIINELLEEDFFPEETIFQCLLSKSKGSLTKDDLRQIYQDHRRCIEAIVTNYVCLVVVHRPTNEIVGVNAMMGMDNPNFPIKDRAVDAQKVYPPESKLVQEYFRYTNSITASSELFVRFPKCKRALEFFYVAVDGRHRQRGLSTLLMKEGIECARSHGADLVFGTFTSPFSKRSAEKLGLKTVIDIDLLKYRDADGTMLFRDSVPHNIVSIMAMLTDA